MKAFSKSETLISNYFFSVIFSVTFLLPFLTKVCRKYYFNIISVLQEGLKEIIERDSFYAPEVHIFETVLAWAHANNMKGSPQLEDVLLAVRFELMSIEDLCKIVRPSGLVSSETILDALERQTIHRDDCLKYRGTLSKYLLLFILFSSSYYHILFLLLLSYKYTICNIASYQANDEKKKQNISKFVTFKPQRNFSVKDSF